MSANNVVDLKGRLKRKSSKPSVEQQQPAAPIIDMTERRQEIITEERRKAKRTILTSFIGAFCVVPRKGLMRVALYDISENGLSFDVEVTQGQFPKEEEIAMRVYLNHECYFPLTVKVQNVRMITGENVYRHGVGFVKGSISDEALHHFVKFIENVSSSLQRDSGDHVATPSAR